MAHRLVVRTAAVAAGLLCFAIVPVVRAQQAQTQGPLAPDKFKNIQALKDIPADQLQVTMNYFVAATGIQCEGCHQAADYSADTDRKKTTRAMIDLVRTVNRGDLLGKINCATCHAGKNRPAGLQLMTPDRLASITAQAAAGQKQPGQPARDAPQPAAPTIDDVINRYAEALGGRAALDRVQSRTVVATMTTPARTLAMTIEQKGAKLRETVTIQPNVVASIVFDGTSGWAQRGDQVIDLDPSQLRSVLRAGRPLLPDQVRENYTDLRTDHPQSLPAGPGGASIDVNVLSGSPAPGVTEHLYFDARSGLLVRRSVTMTTPLWGSLTSQVDYSDYSVVASVKMAQTIRETNANTIQTLTITDIKINTPIDDARFIRPKG